MTGAANWEHIRQVVQLLGHRVPIIANGSISNMDDVRECLKVTGADGIMSSEAILEYPPTFTETNVKSTYCKRTGPSRLQMAHDYLELCKQYPPNEGGHLHRFLHADLQVHTQVREAVVKSFSMEAAEDVIKMVREIHDNEEHNVTEEKLSWYVRHQVNWEKEEEER